MIPRFLLLALLLPLMAACGVSPRVSYDDLLAEMVDLDRLARLPQQPYELIQLSSFDRRSAGPEQPGWYSNWDGFSPGETFGFEAVLRPAEPDAPGLYLLADLVGPGVVVRTWSATMKGVLRVYLDGAEQPLFEGPADEFFTARSALLARRIGLLPQASGLFAQENADYLPLPFARSLRMTWEGQPYEVRYFQVNVRRYPAGTELESFDPDSSLRRHAAAVADAATALSRLQSAHDSADTAFAIPPSETWTRTLLPPQPSALKMLSLRLEGGQTTRALRGVLLRLRFDHASRPQVEAPVGDFFGSGPGINPYRSLPMSVAPDGTMTCRFVMPFRGAATIELVNTTEASVRGQFAWRHEPFRFDDRTMYFRAKWRVDHDLDSTGGPYDLPFLMLRGRGRLVGAACMVHNPRGAAIHGWWGEGDEKIFVDEERAPRIFGTGSEDYFNYAWGGHDLFEYPYCGQPLVTRAFSTGSVSNHRFHVIDDLLFDDFLSFAMELWTADPRESVSYGRIVYHYARPGAVDDHRRLQPAELVAPGDPDADGLAFGGRSAVRWFGGEGPRPWSAQPGERVSCPVEVLRSGHCAVELIAELAPGGGSLRAWVAGEPLALEDQRLELRLRAAEPRLQRVRFRPVHLSAGTHSLVVECVRAGEIRLHQVHTRVDRWASMAIPGAVEAELVPVRGHSEGLVIERQEMEDQAWSGGAHLLVKGTAVGDHVELEVPVERPGRYGVRLYLTGSWDFAELRLSANGTAVGPSIDTFRPRMLGAAPLPPVDLGEIDLAETLLLRLEVVGTNLDSAPPHYFFGVDAIALEAAPEAGRKPGAPARR